MSHKAGPDFFQNKKEWSKYKHLILEYYLKPYLSIVNKRQAPVLLVDLFAGPGKYGDGSVGSPIILAEAARKYIDRQHGIKILAVEQSPQLAKKLRQNTQEYGTLFEIHQCDCFNLIDEIADRARNATTLLYVDPFSIGRLHLGKLAQIYQRISEGDSVELLFVFMANAFLRWAGACLRAEEDAIHVLDDKYVRGNDVDTTIMMAEALWDEESVRIAKYALNSSIELDAIAGGNYWRQYANAKDDAYSDRLAAFVHEYCQQLRKWFKVVTPFPIYASDSIKIRKYWMIFGTRYEPAIDLINRAMATVLHKQCDEWQSGTLFAQVELPQITPKRALKKSILSNAPISGTVEWRRLRWKVTLDNIGNFTDSQINQIIKELLISGELIGCSGSKVDDHALLSKKQ